MGQKKHTPNANTVAARGYAELAHAKIKYIDGDYDVFGDGSVVLLSTPGHTPGHQSLYVKLARTGGVVVSGAKAWPVPTHQTPLSTVM